MTKDTTNNEEPRRPEPKPTGSRENRWEIAGYGEPDMCVCAGSDTLCGVCEEILDRANMAEADAQADATEDPGYEGDEDPYWEQHAEG